MSDNPVKDPVNTATVVAEALTEAGIGHVFSYPGDPIIELMEQLRRRGTDVVLARREGTAAFMAEAAAMATGGIGACLSTLGPGSTALVNGVAAATLDRVPVIALSGQVETARQASFTHQVVEQEALFRPVTKWAGRIESNAAASTMRKAIRVATAERPGAVHLTCAGDTFQAIATDDQVVMPPVAVTAGSIQIARRPSTWNGPVELLRSAQRPILLVGIGAVRQDAGAAVERLARTVQMPIVVAPMAKGVVNENGDWFAGVLDMACNKIVWDFLRESDLIVAAGFDAVELIKPWQLDTPVLHIDATPNVDQIYRSDLEVVGHIGDILNWLADDFTGQPRWSPKDVVSHRSKLRDGYYAGRVAGRLNPSDVVDVVRAVMPAKTIATCDVGSHKLLVGQGWTTTRPRSMLMTNGLSAMGFGVPSAVAAKLVLPDHPVVAMVGDGGFAMTATEMRLAAARGLGIVVVVFVDGSLNRIELKQSALHYASTATRLEDMDLVRLAEAMSCHGERAESVEELEKILVGAGSLDVPLIIEARVDPAQYASQF